MTPPSLLHATLVARRMQGRWAGALVRGASGAGKSDLALRAMAAGWRLVADDRVHVWRSGAALYGCAPRALAGRVEVRGLEVADVAALPFARIRLVADAGAPAERLPDPGRATVAGVALPRVALALLEPSAPQRLALALTLALAPDRAVREAL